MLQHADYTRKRIAQLVDRFKCRIYSQTVPVTQVQVAGPVDRIPYDQAVRLSYRPARLGEQFGPLFATYWFKVTLLVPRDWKGARVDLLWDTHSENTLWIDGKSIQGLNHSNGQDRLDATLLPRARGGQTLTLYLEMACNDAFGMHGKQWPEHRSPIFLDRAELGRFDPLVWDLYHDLEVLAQLEREAKSPMSEKDWVRRGMGTSGDLDQTWGGKLLFELNLLANTIDEEDRDTWKAGLAITRPLLATKNGDCVHNLSAIGHAHIDTAWLWPLAETYRKCVRTFSTQTRYMQEYPEYRFACSQAYQYARIKDGNGDLYRRIKAAAKKGQWVPVGGTWIEPDCNIPSGESLCRQFLFGQRYFEREFGRRCGEFWNPDVFGYNGQLPQIMRQAGITRFLTQKLSWNYFNQPMHHTFNWQGIDGSQVLAHFPPADTYNAECSISQMRSHARQYKDNDRSREAYYLFGYGDGGGGPTRSMIEVLRRTADLQGVPRSAMRSSDEFFDRLEKDAQDMPVVIGELYFELHRGTYTTQAATKRGNRKNEILLHDLEFLAATAARLGGAGKRYAYPQQAVNGLWEIVLLNQFHDILPGSSIGQVYRDTEADHQRVAEQGRPLRDAAAGALAKAAGSQAGGKSGGLTPINTTSFARAEVATQPDGKLAFVQTPSYGIGRAADAPDAVTIDASGKRIVLENAALTATLSTDGRLLSLLHKATGRQALAQAGNVLELFNDRPTAWEAWDVDPWIHETGKPCAAAASAKVASRDPLRAAVVFTRKIGRKSSMTQTVTLDAGAACLRFACDVDWHESQQMLKVAFPMNVRAMHATYEMQFGSVERPTHSNDLIALARYEVPGHRWADLSEHGFGVALLSESKYGYATADNVMRMSLLRSTKSPDPQADMGKQYFEYAVYPHQGGWVQGGVVAAATAFNVPILWTDQPAGEPRSFFAMDDANLVIDTVKQAEDSQALVVRLYECHGARGTAKLRVGLPVKTATLANVMEDRQEKLTVRNGAIELAYTPYQIITVMLD